MPRDRYPPTGRRSERVLNLGLEAVPVDGLRREDRDEKHDGDEDRSGDEPRSPPLGSAPVCHGGLWNAGRAAALRGTFSIRNLGLDEPRQMVSDSCQPR